MGLDAAAEMRLAEQLAFTCYQMYLQMPSRLAPDSILFSTSPDSPPFTSQKGAFMLRPETVESLFVLWRLTGNSSYQQWGWQIEAIEQHCRTRNGYSGVRDVTVLPVKHDGVMQSWFLAETLKYLWLLFSPASALPLDKFVLTRKHTR